MAATSLFDAPVQPVLGGASGWTEGVLGGEFVTALSVIAVASFGLLLLSGRLNLRKGAKIVLGCFLLLGAGALAAELQQVGTDMTREGHIESGQPVIVEPSSSQDLPPAQYDPYAGASLRRN